MNQQEFQSIAQEHLIELWGQKAYPPAQLTRLWRIVVDISATDFRYGLDQLAMTATRAPTLAQIRAAVWPAVQRQLDANRREKIKKLGALDCRLCAGTGWVVAIPYDKPMIDYAFICGACDAHKVRGIQRQSGEKEVRFWSEELRDGYFVRESTSDSVKQAIILQRGPLPAKQRLSPQLRAIAATVTNHQPMDLGPDDSLEPL